MNENVYLGHRRLSIIDLSSAARQPFTSGSGGCHLTYNGEIYNFRSLAADLSLKTQSDTEVLVEGYEKFGVGYFLRLKGIYAFGLVDSRQSKLLLYRDSAGIKPLYYAKVGQEFAFASEIKALRKIFGTKLTTNKRAIESYLKLGYIPEPDTIYNEIAALNPGCLLTLDLKDFSIREMQLFRYSFQYENSFSFNENKEQTDYLLRQAAFRNLVADVNVNLALSGGIDSSLLSYYLRDYGVDKAITIKFGEDAYNEVPTATEFANHLKLSHVVADITDSSQLDLLNKLLFHFDQPFADSSLIPFYFLCREGARHSKVLIGGDGGDEIHNGYLTHRVFPLLSVLQRNWLVKRTSALAMAGHSLLAPHLARFILKYNSLIKTGNRQELLSQLVSWFPASQRQYPILPFIKPFSFQPVFEDSAKTELSDAAYVQAYLFEQRMRSDYLRKADMMSMINGLEYRVPMLDEDLVSFSLTVPSTQKTSLRKSKLMLRSIHSEYFPLPLSNLRKKGFSLPLDTWLGTKALNEIRTNLFNSKGIVKDYIDLEYLNLLFQTLTDKKLQRYSSRESAYQRILILHSLDQWNRNR